MTTIGLLVTASIACTPYNWKHSVGCLAMGEVEWCVIE